MTNRPPRLQSGFTMFEMVLVLALIVIIAAITIPALQDLYGNYVQTAAADAVRACWAEARAHAINEGRTYRFAIIPGKGNYRLAPDSADFWSGNDPASQDEANPPYVLQDALPRGIRFASGDASNDGGDINGETALDAEGVSSDMWSYVVTFLPDGTANKDVEVMFQSRSAGMLLLKLRGMTGSVTAIQLRPDGSRP